MKVAPLCRALESRDMAYSLINTGQHYDDNMSEAFFRDFRIAPHITLNPSRVSAIKQFADIMIGLEDAWTQERPSMVVVVGDVNSTLAGALVANQLKLPLVHVEAGLRSFNRDMPEERNRVLTDRLADLLFVTMEEGIAHLEREGKTENVHLVGNIMIDTLAMFLPDVPTTDERFYFCTLHRAENIDHEERFGAILDALEEIAKDAPIYLPMHPRTEKMARAFGFRDRMDRIFKITPPLSYKDSVYRQKNAALVLTDSGGVQEETSFMGTPCLTLRTETERPITVTSGTSTIAGVTKETILQAYRDKDMEKKKTNIPLWDGHAAERIADIINSFLAVDKSGNHQTSI
jgi:UDP-N-acetylglucosamine 2-epimerase (non-hydrolysing)